MEITLREGIFTISANKIGRWNSFLCLWSDVGSNLVLSILILLGSIPVWGECIIFINFGSKIQRGVGFRYFIYNVL